MINNIDCVQLVKNPIKGFKELKIILQEWLFEHILVEDRLALQVPDKDKYKY